MRICLINYKILTIPNFDKQVKRLVKKYPSFKKDISELAQSLSENPKQGTNLGNNFYKVRMSITSKSKGKRSGARVITFIQILETTVYLSYIYDKSDKSTISDLELKELFKLLPENKKIL